MPKPSPLPPTRAEPPAFPPSRPSRAPQLQRAPPKSPGFRIGIIMPARRSVGAVGVAHRGGLAGLHRPASLAGTARSALGSTTPFAASAEGAKPVRSWLPSESPTSSTVLDHPLEPHPLCWTGPSGPRNHSANLGGWAEGLAPYCVRPSHFWGRTGDAGRGRREVWSRSGVLGAEVCEVCKRGSGGAVREFGREEGPLERREDG